MKRRIDYLYARTLWKHYRVREALEVLEAMQGGEEIPPYWVAVNSKAFLGELYDWLGEGEKAREVYQSLLSLDRKKFGISGSFETKIRERMENPYDPDRAAFRIELLEGKQLVWQGQLQEALAFFEGKKEKYPGNTQVRYWLGQSHFLAGDLAEAEEIFLALTAKDRAAEASARAGAFLRLGQIRDLKGRRKEAVELYLEARRVPHAPEELRIHAGKYLKKACAKRELYPTGE